MESESGSSMTTAGWSFSQIDLPVLVVNALGEIVDFSLGALRYLAAPEETLKGKPLQHFYAESTPGDLLDKLATLKPDSSLRLEARFRVRSGAVLPFLLIAQKLRLEQGNFYLLSLVERSVEEQLRKEVAGLKGELNLVYQRLDQLALQSAEAAQDTQAELSVLYQISRALLTTIELKKVLYIILTCVTAHPAFGFSRAFLLLVNEEARMLEGKMGVGPRSAEEAYRIWHDLSQANWSFEEFVSQYEQTYTNDELPLDSMIRRYRQPLEAECDVLVDAVLTREVIQVENAAQDRRVSPECLEILACNHFVVVPLVGMEKTLGVLVADNLYKDRAITPRDVRLLRLFANHAAMAFQNAAMFSELRENIYRLQQIQEQLVRAERLSAIGEMTAKVAHEIRNPLVTIGGFARSVLKSLPEDSPQARKCEIIADETLRLEEILSSLLDYSRQSELKLEHCRLEEIIGRACSLLRGELRKSNISINRVLQDGLPELMLDVNKTVQVLLNLLKNAMEAMEDGGEITIEAHQQGRYISLRVMDTGEGIPADILGNIFNPFFTTKSEGFGLGLAISRTYIYDHGGNISVKSKVGEGTTFEILLPLPAVPEEEKMIVNPVMQGGYSNEG